MTSDQKARWLTVLQAIVMTPFIVALIVVVSR